MDFKTEYQKCNSFPEKIGFLRKAFPFFSTVKALSKEIEESYYYLTLWKETYGFETKPKRKRKRLSPDEISKVFGFENKLIKDYITERKSAGCEICGYNKYLGSIHFHHLDPKEKLFNLAAASGRTLKEVKLEINKCAILCANCHGEVHAGLINLNKDK